MLTIPTLPQETLEEIVDFLHDDRRALLACSLASTRCLPVSRYHLFSEVKLVSTKLCRFLELLDSPWSSIANTISRIVFTGYDRSQKFPCQWMQRRARSMGLESGTLVEYLPHFPRIRGRLQSVAAIRFADLSTVDIPETMWRVLSVIKSVKMLEMHRVAFEECPLRFLGYLSSLPLLETLSISRPTMLMNPAQLTLLRERIGGGEDCCVRLTKREVGTLFRVPLLDIRRSSQIPSQNQNLSRSAAAGIAWLEWLVAQWPMPAIVSLRMNLDTEPRMVSMLTRYFECAGSSIQALCVTLPSSFPGKIFLQSQSASC
ncbi:hypothetical protein GALMADRAFT_231355 [Galerina marginata CBS 339.88]|uniref:F-box domain-containing protein n=1 Tax=Galerina marginata (strain CBS 339.88) TaxID=685588 RepID=A0A067SBU8_GALM3|nr:hypothetical protein GALMADRAFT_231355 [Galerina marginata CBS 339.88]